MDKQNKKGRLVTNEEEQDFIVNDILNIDERGLWQYNYVDFKKEWQYNYQNFSIMDNSFQNKHPKGLTNYEMQAFNSVRLVLAKTFVQAFDSLEMGLLLAEYSRLSLSFPINKYGFFKASYNTIEKDTGISENLQRKYSKILENLGYIDIVSFRKEKKRFYRFNDDFTRKKLIEFIKKSYKQTPYINKQI